MLSNFKNAIILCFICISSGSYSQKKPNIVLIYTDDQAYYTINALGNKEIETPNMDRLAAMGRSFSNAYNMGAWHGAVCVASRSMLISGRSVWNAKKTEEEWERNEFSKLTWGELMQKGGYETYMTGKWHVSLDPQRVFQHISNIRPGMPQYIKPADAILPGFVSNKNLNVPGYNRPLNEKDHTWSPSNPIYGGYWQGGIHWSVLFKENAIAHIKAASDQDKPFFLYLASNAPHDPRQSPQEYIDKYPLSQISLPKSWLPQNPYRDSIGSSASLRDEALAPFPRTELAIKTHIQEYYAAITYLDKQIGEILDALEASGKMDNTYIFFTADHGLAMGRHGFMGKQTLFEHSMKPPLIAVGPGIPKNTKSDIPVYLQDIMATSLELAGIKKPDYIEFKSFLDLARGKSTKPLHESIYGAYMDLQRSVRKDEYKLIVFPKYHKILLFDLKKDPEEMHDLSGVEKYKPISKQLFQELLKQQKLLNDPLDIKALVSEI